MKTKHIYLLIIVMLMGAVSVSQSIDKKTVYNNLIKKYGNIRAIIFDFQSADGVSMHGNITAKRGNKYVLKMSDRTIVSDGKKIWNYSKNDNNVIISNYSDIEQSASLENFFFDFLNNYEPVSLEEQTASNNLKPGYKLKLQPRKGNSAIDNVTEIVLYLDRNQDLTAISLDSGSSYQFWEVKNIKVNPALQETAFTFKVPENAEVISLD